MMMSNIHITNERMLCSVCRSRVIFFEKVKINGTPAQMPLYRKFGTNIHFCSPSCSTLYQELSFLFLTNDRIQKWLDFFVADFWGKSARDLAEEGKTLQVIADVREMLKQGVDVGEGVDDGR